MFIGRESELALLNKLYTSDKFEFVVMYGRRRVGKTALISEFIKDKKAIYFMGVESNLKQNLENFSKNIMEFNIGLQADISFSSFQAGLEYIIKLAENERIILAIDEYPYVAKASESLASTLQMVIDKHKGSSKLMLILCGSSMSYMEDKVLAYKSPLYGRRTAQIKLQPIKFKYYDRFFKNKSTQDLIELYSITGGIPKYILSIDREQSALYNIENNLFDKNNYLYSEPKFLLQEEVNDLSRYFSILNAISIGHTKMSSISSYLQINAGGISAYISKLIELDILEKEIPITENIDNSKKVLYKIKDNYLKFWFAYIYPYQSYFEIENLTYVKNKIRSEFELYVSKIYEDLARESMWENVPFPLLKVGRWWDKNTEVDIVALGENNKIVFGECKYSKKQVGLSILKQLQEKAKNIKWNNNNREEYFILFSKSGFSEELEKLAQKEKNIILKKLV